jgi:hypothetical protein
MRWRTMQPELGGNLLLEDESLLSDEVDEIGQIVRRILWAV